MPKANLTLRNGAKVTIEGTTEEIAELTEKLTAAEAAPSNRGGRGRRRAPRASTTGEQKKTSQRKGPIGLIRELREEDFFKSKRGIGDVQKKLEEKGHIYALTSLSPALLKLTKGKELRRIKENSAWQYVNP